MRYEWRDSIRWIRFIWMLRNSNFRYAVKYTLFYALNNYEEKRGEGASDVLFFDHDYANKLIVKNKHV